MCWRRTTCGRTRLSFGEDGLIVEHNSLNHETEALFLSELMCTEDERALPAAPCALCCPITLRPRSLAVSLRTSLAVVRVALDLSSFTWCAELSADFGWTASEHALGSQVGALRLRAIAL